MNIEKLNEELAYYNQINKINEEANILGHFKGQIDKDLIKEIAENFKIGYTNFLIILESLHSLRELENAPKEAIKTIENFLDEIIFEKAKNNSESFKPAINLGIELVEHLTNKYKTIFGYEPSEERENELKKILLEYSSKFELKFKKEEKDLNSLPF